MSVKLPDVPIYLFVSSYLLELSMIFLFVKLIRRRIRTITAMLTAHAYSEELNIKS